MKEIRDDIWNYYEKSWIVIPVNGDVKDGRAVMDKGLALQANERIEYLDKTLGYYIQNSGNKPVFLMGEKIIAFPVSDHWNLKANLHLIEESAKSIVETLNKDFEGEDIKIYIPKVGCGEGGLNWKDVKPILKKYLDDRFVVCDLNSDYFT